ncbi:hypothetical protein FB556_1163 [Enteractinococcus coprophilus]|uniref:Uncharacterized protein n=1 Tax=Enteractinococcus coprophilus TaxID=1027633 RepID=A0A543AIV2_9MICC|nr:hypothetical protein FB556_1163 [Enteractinococcus coprophilus]
MQNWGTVFLKLFLRIQLALVLAFPHALMCGTFIFRPQSFRMKRDIACS